jgi:hypothetical protein
MSKGCLVATTPCIVGLDFSNEAPSHITSHRDMSVRL